MTIKHSIIVGCTNYNGATIDDIIDEVKYFKKIAKDTIDKLKEYKQKIKDWEPLWIKANIEEDVDEKIETFKSFINNFNRLIKELPNGVARGHCDLLDQISSELGRYKHFKQDFKERYVEQICRANIKQSPDKKRIVIEAIYCEIIDIINIYGDISNLRGQLLTYVGVTVKIDKKSRKTAVAGRKEVSKIDKDDWKPQKGTYLLLDHETVEKQTSVKFYIVWKGERKKLPFKEGGQMHALFNAFITERDNKDKGIVRSDDMKEFLETVQAPSRAVEDLNKSLVNKLKAKKCDAPDIIVGYSTKQNGYITRIPIITSEQLEQAESFRKSNVDSRDVEERFDDGFQIEDRHMRAKNKK